MFKKYLLFWIAPPGIAYNSRGTFAEPLAVGMVTSDEPGYYEEGEFGIRLETDLEVVEAKTEVFELVFIKFNILL